MAYSQIQIQNNFEFLFNSVVSGIYNNVVRRRLIELAPATENEIRTTVTRLVAEERRKIQLGCSDSPSMDGLLAVSRNSYSHVSNGAGPAPSAMDLNQISVLRPATKDDVCNRCGKRGHWAKECRAAWPTAAADRGSGGGRAAGAAGGAGGAGGRNKPPGGAGRGKPGRHPTASEKKNNTNKRCRFCRRRGHLEADCYQKKNGQLSTASKKYFKKTGVKQLGDGGDPVEHEESENEGFLDEQGEESE